MRQPDTRPNPPLTVNRRAAIAAGCASVSALSFGRHGWAAAGGEVPAAFSNGVPPKIRRIIFLNMTGGTSQVDMVDPKPILRDRDGETLPQSLFEKGERFANVNPESKIMASPYRFEKAGDAGMAFSELLPHMSTLADKICMIRSMTSPEINHPAAQQLFQTGFPRPGRPSIGSWITYALPPETEQLPGFVLLQSGEGCECGQECSSSGFLPKKYQSIRLSTGRNPIYYLENPSGLPASLRAATIDAIADLNDVEQQAFGDPSIDSRTTMYRQALRLQHSVPEATDLHDEPQYVLDAYGANPDRPSFAANCLLARRLLERGVRFVQLNHGDWDLHGEIFKYLPLRCRETDQPTAALVNDLEQSGMLDDTLVIWGTEFGRTPMRQGETGRDHHKSFTIWLAGGEVKHAHLHGETDPFGFNIVSGAIPVHDLQATILHLMGIDHEKLTYEYQGRRHRLTDVAGNVRHELLA